MGSQYNVNGYMHLVQYINKSLLNIITRIETSNIHNSKFRNNNPAHKFTKWFGNFPFNILQNFGIFKGPFGKEPEKIKPLFSTN